MRKSKGNVADIMASGICILAMTVVMLAYMDSVALFHQKTEAGQIARKYILRMETVGYLTAQDHTALLQELNTIGITEISLEGSTMYKVSYGYPITLHIIGKLKGEYPFEEKRVSTAKN